MGRGMGPIPPRAPTRNAHGATARPEVMTICGSKRLGVVSIVSSRTTPKGRRLRGPRPCRCSATRLQARAVGGPRPLRRTLATGRPPAAPRRGSRFGRSVAATRAATAGDDEDDDDRDRDQNPHGEPHPPSWLEERVHENHLLFRCTGRDRAPDDLPLMRGNIPPWGRPRHTPAPEIALPGTRDLA
jgi:hypothetical protein